MHGRHKILKQNVTSGTFTEGTGLKQGDALSLVLFNKGTKKVVRILQENHRKILQNWSKEISI